MIPNATRLTLVASSLALAVLSGCGGGISHPNSPSSSPMPVQVSAANPAATPPCSNAVPSTNTSEMSTAGSGIQPQIAAIPGGAVIGVWQQDRWSGIGAKAIATARSTDNGATWSAPMVLPFSKCSGTAPPGGDYDRASDPWVTFTANGVVVASALGFSADGTASGTASVNGLSGVMASRSTDGGITWSTPMLVMDDRNPSTNTAFYFNDRDSITADASGNVYLVWDRLSTGVNASMPAWLALSKDAGLTWTTNVLYDPVTAGSEAFNNEIAILPNGTVLDFFTLRDLVAGTGMLEFVTVTVAANGTSWSTNSPTIVAAMQPVGTLNPITNGSAIRDSPYMAQIAVDPATGAIAAVWQQELSTTATFDGIALSVSANGGATWSTPKLVNGVKTVAAFTPTVRYLPGSVLAITYYDFRDYMSGSSVLSTDVWLTESNDGGTTWHELRLQSPFDLTKAPPADSGFGTALFLGDNQGLALVGSNPLPFYAATVSPGTAHVFSIQPPNPLTASSAHVYTASVSGPVPAAAAARSQADVERMRLRGRPPVRRP
jgi:hypothetical protein